MPESKFPTSRKQHRAESIRLLRVTADSMSYEDAQDIYLRAIAHAVLSLETSTITPESITRMRNEARAEGITDALMSVLPEPIEENFLA